MNDKQPEVNAKEYSQEIINRFTTLATLLGGFTFAGLTVLITNVQQHKLYRSAFVLTGLSTIFLVTIGVIGSYLGIVTKLKTLTEEGSFLYKMGTVFIFGTYGGILFFFINISILSFLVSNSLGIIISIASFAAFILIMVFIGKIGTYVGPPDES